MNAESDSNSGNNIAVSPAVIRHAEHLCDDGGSLVEVEHDSSATFQYSAEELHTLWVLLCPTSKNTDSGWKDEYTDSLINFLTAVESVTPAHTLQRFVKQIFTHIGVVARARIADNEKVPPTILAVLSRDESSKVRINVACHPNASPDVLLKLSQDTHTNVRSWVSSNPHTPPEALTLLSRDNSLRVRKFVADNISTPRDALASLSQGTTTNWWVAGNPNASTETLTFLSTSADSSVRKQVAGNPSAPPETLTQLAEDADPAIRKRVANNPATLTITRSASVEYE